MEAQLQDSPSRAGRAKKAKQEPAFTLTELAETWKVSVETLRARVIDGSLIAFSVNGVEGKGGDYRVLQSSVDRYIRENPAIKDPRGRKPKGQRR